jgi:carboxyl-terminal processing protease
MTPMLRFLRATAVAWLAASGAACAATPAVTGEMLAPLSSAYLRAVTPGEEAELHRELFGTVLLRVQRSYAYEVDMPQLIAAAVKTIQPLAPGSGEPGPVFTKAINAALASLDPYSRYFDARAASQFRSSITGAFGGLGLQVEMVDKLVRVAATIPGTPAARAGLQGGDLILRLDDQPVEGMTLTDAIARMRGEPGTPIELTIRRSGREDEFTVSLVRAEIRREPVRWSLEGDVLVLRLLTFTSGAFGDLEKAIAEGSAEIVSLRGRTPGNRRSWQADPSERLAGVPMVVLIDGRTASAAELVAAALQENGRATVMGQRSFGKGSVQAMLGLGEGKGALRLTTALYHGPSGRTVQRTGVGPDIELVPVAAVGNRRREADRARALAGADEPPPPKARVEEARCGRPLRKADPALACALAFIDAGGLDGFLMAAEPAK